MQRGEASCGCRSPLCERRSLSLLVKCTADYVPWLRTDDVLLPFDACEPLTGDELDWVPQWREVPPARSGEPPRMVGLSSLKDDTLVLQISLLDAELFSLAGDFHLRRRYPNSGAGLDPGYWA